jgi:transposase
LIQLDQLIGVTSIWAVEGCNGIGRHIAQRLVADGETVVDVPAKLSARARVFGTGQGRETDPVDAHSVAVAALRSKGLREVGVDDETVVLRLLVERRDGLGHARTDLVDRIHRVLLELLPGGAKTFLSADQARALLATIRPRDLVGRTRRRLASELIGELVQVDKKIKAAKQELTALVKDSSSSPLELNGIGPSGAARLIGDIRRFASRGHFASWNGTAPLDASSGDQRRTACPEPATGASTVSCTSWPSCNSATTPPAGPTTGAVSRRARHLWKPFER